MRPHSPHGPTLVSWIPPCFSTARPEPLRRTFSAGGGIGGGNPRARASCQTPSSLGTDVGWRFRREASGVAHREDGARQRHTGSKPSIHTRGSVLDEGRGVSPLSLSWPGLVGVSASLFAVGRTSGNHYFRLPVNARP